MNFKGKKFQYVEIAEGSESNRNIYTTLSLAEKLTWSKKYKKQAWRSIYSYCDIKNTDVSYAGYYFESDIEDFELNRKIILYVVHYLNTIYDIPLNAFKFKLTNKSIWVEIIPTVMGIKPSYKLNEIFREITKKLNKVLEQVFKIKEPLDTKVYSSKQLTRLTGSYLTKSKRYVIELELYEIENLSKQELFSKARFKRKITYPQNDDFYVSEEAQKLFEECKNIVYKRYKNNYDLNILNNKEEKICIKNMEEIGVKKGSRNLSIFYASIHFRDLGFKQEECIDRILEFVKNFDKEKLDRYSQIKATVKSVYKNKYVFSCKKVRENFADYCDCINCPFKRDLKDNVFIIYRDQLNILFKNKANKNLFIALYKLMYNYYHNSNLNISKDLIKKLKELKVIDIKDNKIIPIHNKKSFIQVPNEFINLIDNFQSEIILFSEIIYSSKDGQTLNPKMDNKKYAKKLGKTTRTIQRQLKALKDKGFICDAKIMFTPDTLKSEENKTNNEKVISINEYKKEINKRRDKHLKSKDTIANNNLKIIYIFDFKNKKAIIRKHNITKKYFDISNNKYPLNTYNNLKEP